MVYPFECDLIFLLVISLAVCLWRREELVFLTLEL